MVSTGVELLFKAFAIFVQPSYRRFAHIGGTPLFKKLPDLCFPFAIIL
jgi:hypothetical protein